MSFTLKKEERLCKKKDIETLISKGNSMFQYPFKIFWVIHTDVETFSLKAAFSVSKRKFKRANKRNLIKRRMREAYRLQKGALKQFLLSKNHSVHMMFVYVANDIKNFGEINEKVTNVLGTVLEKVQACDK